MEFSIDIFMIGTYFYSLLILSWFWFPWREKSIFLLAKRVFKKITEKKKNLLKPNASYNFAFFIISLTFIYEVNEEISVYKFS